LKKILVIRFSSIGDIVLTTPIVRAIKKQYEAEVHTLTKIQYAGLYQNNPYVEKVFSLEKSLSEVLKKLKKENYDYVVDLQKNFRSIEVRKYLNTPYGTFPKKNIAKWLLVNFKINKLPDVHIVDRYFEAVKDLNIKKDNKGLEYFIALNDRVNIKMLDEVYEKGYVAFAIGGQHYTKILPAVKVVEIIKKLRFPVILLGGKDDYERGEEIVKLLPKKKIFNACGKFNLNQSASVIKQCRVLVTNDTGLMHIGAAFRKYLVSIWGNTVPDFGMYPYMPGDEDKFYISQVDNLRCRPCSKLGYKKCPKNHFKCMMEQNVDDIVGIISEFWKKSKTEKA
jgi:heptosyltransferase-2